MSVSRVLIVDYGGVLGDHHQLAAESKLAEVFDVDVAKIRLLLSENSEHGVAFREDKIDETTFWDVVAILAGIDKYSRQSNEYLSELWAKTYSLNEEVNSILSSVRKNTPVGVLTNIDRARSDYLVNSMKILSKVDLYFPSYKYCSIKPKSDIFRAVTGEIKSRFGQSVEIVYFDDRERHVSAAMKHGWNGIIFEFATQFEDELKKIGLV